MKGNGDMFEKLAKKAVSLLAAIVMSSSSVSPVYAEDIVTTEAVTEATTEEVTDLTFQSLELYPNGEEAEQVVTLDGLMPEGAEATAVDVSDEHDGIAAYDITITDGENDYQPGEENPILVEITDPVITEDITLWHILDDGTREQIFDFTAEEGKVSFYATGFSVYEIVEDVEPLTFTGTGWQKIKSVSELISYSSSGLYISNYVSDATTNGFYMKDNSVQAKDVNGNNINNRYGIEKTKGGNTVNSDEKTDIYTAISKGAAKYYFEQVIGTDNQPIDNQFYIYCLKNGVKNYVYLTSGGGGSLYISSDSSKKEIFLLDLNTDNNKIRLKGNTSGYYWNMVRDDKGNCIGSTSSTYADNTGSFFSLWYYVPIPNDPYQLNNKSYGLMEHTSGSSYGYGLVAGDSVPGTKLYQLPVLDEAHNERVLYVTESSDITKWTFVNKSEDNYYLRSDAGTYLKCDEGVLSLTSNSEEATAFKVLPNSDNSVRVNAGDYYIHFNGTSFEASTSPTDLYLVLESSVPGSDSLTCTAEMISVSDGDIAKDGAQVIVYTRVWDEDEKKYNYYAIDHNGSLRQVYAYGDKIMWLDDTMNTLLWEFSVYYNNDGTENGYYDLRNTFSDKYIAPQRTSNQTLSDDTIGILMQGREYKEKDGKIYYGEYYSNIIAWDNGIKQYVALAADNESGTIKTVPFANADTFYFATFDDSSTSGSTVARLHEVATVDNTEYGITMRMIDFGDDSKSNSSGSDITSNYFGGNTANTKGLLSASMDENGHPTVAKTSCAGKDFDAAFDGAVLTNHIFIESIHNSTGYFEYDSCQNFATLVPDGSGLVQQTDKNHNPLYVDKDGKLTTVSSYEVEEGGETVVKYNEPIYDFTVYRELGTLESSPPGNTRRHGQFLPYNYIKPNSFSNAHPLNLYSVLTNYKDPDPNNGILKDSDPRKYEKLHATYRKNKTTGNEENKANYYVGMEMDATFVQTPNGLDAWGNDVIFEFTGDDDFWLYVDGELVLDFGGIHSAEYGTVNFRTGKVTYSTYDVNNDNLTKHETTLREIFKAHYKAKGHDEAEAEEYVSGLFEYNEEKEKANQGYVFRDYTTHEMKVYYMERGAGASNLHMRFNLSAVTPGNVLFAKTLSGAENSDMDFSLVEYPFQIFYKIQESDEDWIPLTDTDTSGNVSVKYQSSTQTVRFASTYVPPSGAKTYDNVFFLVPGRNIEINFPDEAMYYYVVECAVNSDIYDLDDPTANNGTVHLDSVVVSGNIKDLKTAAAQVSMQPTIAFDNKLQTGMVRTLNIKKNLYNENYVASNSEVQNEGNLLRYDPKATTGLSKVDNTRFKYRLSFYDEASKKWEPADLHRYYLTDPDGYFVVWEPDASNPGEGWYERYNIGTEDAPVYVNDVATLTQKQKQDITIYTSRFGAIDDVPAGYTVKVPGLIVGTKFLVEERDYEIPVGYDLIKYKCRSALVNGSEEQNSYQTLSADESAGMIVGGSDAFMDVSNRRGIGLEANKVWSDADFTSSHDKIYVAVFLGDRTEPIDGTVLELESPETRAKYFFESLQPGYSLSDYHIYEVKVEGAVVSKANADDKIGKVTSYTSLTKLESGDMLDNFRVEDNAGNPVYDDYTVSYAVGQEVATGETGSANVRIDTIHNKRKGGLEINLYQWNTSTDPSSAETPLSGGKFEITVNSVTNAYESDGSGNVTVLYGLQSGDVITVREISSPRGFIGMKEPVSFTITGSEGNYSIASWDNKNDSDDDENNKSDGRNWAEYSTQESVMIAKIDIYNKPYTFDVKKIDGTTKVPLDNVEFRLYKDASILGVMQKAFDPMAGYESLLTDTNGIIPKVDNTLPPLKDNKRYYLMESRPKEGYAKLQEDVIFTISPLGVIECENEELLEKKEEQIGNTLHVTYTISVPNTTSSSEYFFNIEKLSLLDSFIHNSDDEQKFVFRVDYYGETDTHNPASSFYVTMNANGSYTFEGDSPLPSTSKYSYNKSANTVTVTYTPNGGTETEYTFVPIVRRGIRNVKVFQKGLYKVTELTNWSKTDYDFWLGSNVYKGSDSSKMIEQGTDAMSGSDPYVWFKITDTDTVKDNAATASFTNTETEYAYLSSQAYAENKIKRSST